MKRTDDFWEAINYWMGHSGHKHSNVRRLAIAIVSAVRETTGRDCTLGEALDFGSRITHLRNVGRTGVVIYEEFSQWAKSQLEESKLKENSTATTMNEVVIGYFGEYEVEHIGSICHVKLYDLENPDGLASYKVSVINGTLFIFQYDAKDPDDLFAERVISNFDVDFEGEWAAR